ncbi:Uncharacterized protein Adt_27060 [Abeliophyllum distichum]|uniref:Uncharacterized protein n=1 Tax=Abeliophyllum distichum TaxID=126358 RepID=A0ABD1RSN5_9LAMI
MTAPSLATATVVLPQPPPANNNVDYFFELEKGSGWCLSRYKIMLGKVEDLERLRIEEQQGAYRRRNDDNLSGGFAGGDYYKVLEKFPPVSIPSGPPGYWPKKQFVEGVFPSSTLNTEQSVYMMYHSPMVRQVSEPASQLLRSSNDAIGGLPGLARGF